MLRKYVAGALRHGIYPAAEREDVRRRRRLVNGCVESREDRAHLLGCHCASLPELQQGRSVKTLQHNAAALGILGGWLVAIAQLDLAPGLYINDVFDSLTLADVASGVGKSFFFGYFIAIIFGEVTLNTAFWPFRLTVTVKRCPPAIGTLLP